MVVVVPPFTHGQYGQKEIVTAVIRSCEAATSETVGQGRDREGAVVEHHGGNNKPPYQHLPTVRPEGRVGPCQPFPGEEEAEGEKRGNDDVESVQKA